MWIDIDHTLYVAYRITSNYEGFSYEIITKRNKIIYPTQKDNYIKYWKTKKGASNAILKFLQQ